MTDLHSLLTRVEAATGPDRELDEEIFSALDLAPKTFFGSPVISHSIRSRVVNTADGMRHLDAFEIGHYTASLDAALALVGEMLPGSEFEMGSTSPPEGEGQFWVVVWARQKSKRISKITTANTLPLAVLSALLRAIIAKQEVADEEA